MNLVIGIPAALILLGLVAWALWRAARAYWKLHGRRVVTCPETGQPAAVDLAMWHIALTATFSEPTLRLRDCSRWRQRERCNQPCLGEILAAAEDCLVLTILSKWYRGKACICCGRPAGRISRWGRNPCLMSPDLRMLEWKDIEAENISQMLATHSAVCRTCLVAETHTS